jgi:uncharacterized protein (UPF0261 family)
MRTTVDENRQLGQEIARKVAASRGPAALLLPLQGVSAIDRAGQPFDDPVARRALFESVRAHAGTAGQPIIGGGAGTGISAKMSERAGSTCW